MNCPKSDEEPFIFDCCLGSENTSRTKEVMEGIITLLVMLHYITCYAPLHYLLCSVTLLVMLHNITCYET